MNPSFRLTSYTDYEKGNVCHMLPSTYINPNHRLKYNVLKIHYMDVFGVVLP
jgi:hypothetical protein